MRTQSAKTKKLLCLLGLVLVLIIFLVSSAYGQEVVKPLKYDVVVIIDNSGSMDGFIAKDGTKVEPTDPDKRRFAAGGYLIDYLAISEAGNIEYRVGIISFGEDAQLISELTNAGEPVLRQRVREIGSIKRGFTNFDQALDVAIAEMKAKDSFSQGHVPAIIVLTDGQLHTNSYGLDRETYVQQKLRSRVELLRELGGRLYLLTISEAGKDIDTWKNLTDLTGGFARSLSSPEELVGAYHDIAVILTGGVGEQVAKFSVEPDATAEASYDLAEKMFPYVDYLVITLFRSSPDVRMVVVDPQEDEVIPVPAGGVERIGEGEVLIYRISNPSYGRWTLRAIGNQKARAAVQVFVDRKQFAINVNAPDPYQPLRPGQAMDFDIILTDRNLNPVHQKEGFPLILNAAITKPNGHTVVIPEIRSLGDSRYGFTFSDTDQAGRYRISVTASWTTPDRKIYEPRVQILLNLTIAPLPTVLAVEPQEAETGRSVPVQAAIQYAEEQSELKVAAWLFDSQGRRVQAVPLLDDGQEPDKEAGDHIYSGLLASLAQAGDYMLTIHLEGQTSILSLRYGRLGDKYNVDKTSIPLKVATVTPVIAQISLVPSSSVEVGQAITVFVQINGYEQAKILNAQGVLTDAAGALVNEVTLHDDGLGPDETANDGLFAGRLPAVPQPGDYTLKVRIQGTHLTGARFTEDATQGVKVIAPTDLPAIAVVEGPSSIEAGQVLPVSVRVTHRERAKEIDVEATLVDETGKVASQAILRDDGLTPDEVRGDGLYTGVLPGVLKLGNYVLSVRVKGVHLTGFPFSQEATQPARVVAPAELPSIDAVKTAAAGVVARGQPIVLYADVAQAERAAELAVTAVVVDEGGNVVQEVPLHDDGQSPDVGAKDGRFSGLTRGLAARGHYTVTARVEGRSASGYPFQWESDRSASVAVGWSLGDLVLRGGIGLVLLGTLGFLGFRWREERKSALPLGTLRVVRPAERRGQSWFLDNFEAKEVTLGLDAGHISLSAGQLPIGLCARFYGRKEGREVVTYVEGIRQEAPVLIGGTPLARGEKVHLFEGSRLEIGDYVLEYVAPRLETY